MTFHVPPSVFAANPLNGSKAPHALSAAKAVGVPVVTPRLSTSGFPNLSLPPQLPSTLSAHPAAVSSSALPSPLSSPSGGDVFVSSGGGRSRPRSAVALIRARRSEQQVAAVVDGGGSSKGRPVAPLLPLALPAPLPYFSAGGSSDGGLFSASLGLLDEGTEFVDVDGGGEEDNLPYTDAGSKHSVVRVWMREVLE